MLDYIRRLSPRSEFVLVNLLCFGFFAGLSTGSFCEVSGSISTTMRDSYSS